jgi:NAD(P)-dependent dehydrogenase (short-subunit alcohol dehydrogenase family)
MKLEDKVVMVTGANRGIGKALVEALLSKGAKRIYATARDDQSLAALAAIDPKRVVPVQLDVTKPAEVETAAKKAEDLQILINNAGLLRSFSLLTASREDVQRDLDTNFFGALALTRATLPALERAAGRGESAVVNILTIVSLASMAGLGGYSASKAAAFSMTQALRAELKPRKIAVHAVFPGPVDTDMTKGIALPKASPESVAKAIVEGLARGEEDIGPDPMSAEVIAKWKVAPKAVEEMFASM